MNRMRSIASYWLWSISALVIFGAFWSQSVDAYNMRQYSDTISDSGPAEYANHTFRFTPTTAIPPSSTITVDFPIDFSIITGTSTFGIRNVELLVNNVVRDATTSAGVGVDGVSIVDGVGGTVVYTLGSDLTISAGANVQLRIGNHSTRSTGAVYSYSTSTGTTTIKGADIEPIQNPIATGRHDISLAVSNGSVLSENDFIIFINQKVGFHGDTTEEIPPYRFNGYPTSTVGGTTLSVEIGLETDEFAICRYSTTPGVAYGSMTNTFSNTGLIYHSQVVAVVQGQLNQFYIRCIDDEGNFNIDDYIIAFAVNDAPTGTSNTTGSSSGDGTGSGDSGTGDGSGSGGTTGDSDGGANTTGGSSGGGGGGSGGGGSGGGRGEDDDDTAGGGFESTNGPYQSGDGRVVISGIAFPNSLVSAIVDGYLAETVRANSSGNYSITIDEIARGVYTFGVFATDQQGVDSSVFSTSFTVIGARTSNLSNINLSPSILVEPDPADVGDVITVSGYALPNALVTIENSKERSSIAKTVTTNSNSSGFWSAQIDSSSFSRGIYQVRAKSSAGGVETKFSDYTYYGVGEEVPDGNLADLNRDGSVNLIDFSILLFWWNTDGGDSDPPADINRDNRVTLTDFSILLFNWTG